MSNRQMIVAGRPVGDGAPTFIIAEIGINHNGDVEIARQMIAAAAASGADAVKFQTYKTETMVARGNPYYEIFKNAEISEIDELKALQAYSEEQGVLFFSSATTESGLEILERLDIPLYKVSSANLTNIPLLRRVAEQNKPVILSSGAATLSEVLRAAEVTRQFGAAAVAILKCTSIYPCPPELANLEGIATLRQSWDDPVGFSDHTMGIEAACAAVTLGATIIEKHFTLDRAMEGHDHHFSATPEELAQLVGSVRKIEKMGGSPVIAPVGWELEFREVARRFVVALESIGAGDLISADKVCAKRPKDGPGILPEHLDVVTGRIARNAIEAGNSVKWQDV